MSRSRNPRTNAYVSSVFEMSFEIHGSNAQRGVNGGGSTLGAATPPSNGQFASATASASAAASSPAYIVDASLAASGLGVGDGHAASETAPRAKKSTER